MDKVKKMPIQPSARKDNGRWHLYIDDISMPSGFIPLAEQNHIVSVPRGALAGNHKHVRQEILLGLHPDLMLIWQDENGKKHTEEMNPKGELTLIFVPSLIPHVVINKSQTSPAIFFEWTDSRSLDQEDVNLL